MKKLFAFLIVVIMVASMFVGCTPSNDDPSSSSSKKPVVGENGSIFPLAEEFKLTLITTTGGTGNWKNAIEANVLWQDLYERTNVKVEIVPLTAADRNERMTMLTGMMNTGMYWDAVLTNFMNETGESSLVATKKFLDLNEYVRDETIMPNLQVVLDEAPYLLSTWTWPDGGIYDIGYYSANHARFLESCLWVYEPWLKAANMEVPTTFDEFEAMLYYFSTHDMNGNGKDDEIALFCWQEYGYATIEALMGMWGMPTKDGTNDNYVCLTEDHEVVFAPVTDAWKDFITTFSKWWDDGIVYDGCFTADNVTANSHWQAAAGKPVVVGCMTYNVPPTRGQDDYIAIVPPAADGYETRWFFHPSHMGGKRQVAINRQCENPEIVLAWFDLFFSSEVYQRYMFGETGSPYQEVDRNGKIVAATPNADVAEMIWETNQQRLYGILGQFPNAVLQSDYDTWLGLSEAEKTQQDAFRLYQGVLCPSDLVWPRPYLSDDQTDEISEVRTDVFNTLYSWRAAFIEGDPEDVDAQWEEFLEDLETAGVEIMVEQLQDAYDTWADAMDF